MMKTMGHGDNRGERIGMDIRDPIQMRPGSQEQRCRSW